ncbi:ASCH domain-containing protein [Carboxydothermus pertinax]|uniref:Transcriptional regulator n=1 Tax=Carboxydothermus pertinax TaxID=870242 RepID=A0A1L8CWK2_9THEO|nr:ASCH domain-containing protein [Carboxydothermus pertinax]GAV23290.1 transcriptional regulator [Carboxydothermus pertinax]
MCKILLSINPKHVEKIFSGIKKYEYRKTIFKRKNIEKILIYSTHPIKMIVGEANIEEIIIDEPHIVWEITKDFAGINREFFEDYFKGRKKAIAYKLRDIRKYNTPIELKTLGIDFAPQSFIYID